MFENCVYAGLCLLVGIAAGVCFRPVGRSLTRLVSARFRRRLQKAKAVPLVGLLDGVAFGWLRKLDPAFVEAWVNERLDELTPAKAGDLGLFTRPACPACEGRDCFDPALRTRMVICRGCYRAYGEEVQPTLWQYLMTPVIDRK